MRNRLAGISPDNFLVMNLVLSSEDKAVDGPLFKRMPCNWHFSVPMPHAIDVRLRKLTGYRRVRSYPTSRS
jgi:hypothetical protein